MWGFYYVKPYSIKQKFPGLLQGKISVKTYNFFIVVWNDVVLKTTMHVPNYSLFYEM